MLNCLSGQTRLKQDRTPTSEIHRYDKIIHDLSASSCFPMNDFSPPVEKLKATVPRVDSKFLLAHPAHLVALGFGSGLSPIGPGTAGTLWAWLAFAVLQNWLTPAQFGSLIAGAIVVGWWACTVTARNMAVADPGSIVWDEVVAFWLVLWLASPSGIWAQFGYFLLFRFFDVAKPGPIAWADRQFKGFGPRGGFGILFDDLVAAFCTLLVIVLWRSWM
jgi:phosphatidylglycerophosphatase A